MSSSASRNLRNLILQPEAKLPAGLQGNALAGIGYSVAQNAWNRGQTWWRTHRTWTVTVSGDDELYFDVHEWLAAQGSHETRRALAARTRWISNPFGPSTSELQFLADDEAQQNITVRGHDVLVHVSENDGQPTGQDTGMGMKILKPPRLVFTAKTRLARDAVVEELKEIRRRRADKKRAPGLMVLDKWGEWRRRNDLPPRPLESVITKGDVVADLRGDLAEFLSREAEYVRLAIPYHRAYLLVGPPGTGKTSAVRALSNALKLDLWYAQLTGIDKDTKLSDVLGEVRSGGMLLLEDIDSLPAAVDRTEEKPEGDISTSGLLNALDGVATPHGLITVMTTNHPEHLDPALLRPGRIDRIFYFENPDAATLQRHFEFFYGEPPRVPLDPQGRSSAAISEIFKRNMNDPEGALAALLAPHSQDEEQNWHKPVLSGKRDQMRALLGGGLFDE